MTYNSVNDLIKDMVEHTDESNIKLNDELKAEYISINHLKKSMLQYFEDTIVNAIGEVDINTIVGNMLEKFSEYLVIPSENTSENIPPNKTYMSEIINLNKDIFFKIIKFPYVDYDSAMDDAVRLTKKIVSSWEK
jgi:homogentisate 1,2-dioxygenase